MNSYRNRIRRIVGLAVIAAIWGVLLALLGFLGCVYAIYADLKASSRSTLTAGTGAEYVAGAIYDRFRSPWKTQPDPELIYVPIPGAGRVRTPEYDTTITITEQGTRLQPAPAADGDLVVVAGDSFALGLGVQDDQTYSAILQQRYHHNTINTGVISYGTARELWRLRRMGLLARASVVIIQFCENDGRENSDFLKSPDGHFGRADTGHTWAFVKNAYYPELSYGSVLTATVTYLRQRMQEEGGRALVRSVIHSRRTSLGSPIHTRDNRSGAVLAADFLGVLDQFPELKDKRILVTELDDRGGSTGFMAALAELARDRANLRVVPIVFEADDFFRFDGHLVPKGHEKVAAAMDRALRDAHD